MKKYLIYLFTAFIGMSFLSQAVYAGDAAKGASLVAVCSACHGQDGNSPAGSFPNIAGQNEQYLLKQLMDVQSGDREIVTMTGLLDNYSQTDLENIAAFYASKERAYGAADPELVELGENIYMAGIERKNVAACVACHSPTGQGNGPAKFPALAGQWPEYTIAQLKAFQAGERHNDGESRMMRTTAMDMNEKEMQAVAAYIYGLR